MAATLVITLLFSAVVPFHMDEVIAYLWIRCYDYPGNFVTPNDDCTGFWSMNVLGTGIILPLRVYFYAGAIPSLFYYPIYFIWKSYLSARWLGVLWILAQSYCIQQLFRIPMKRVFIALILFLPYVFQHIVDTGPVGLQITGVFVILWLTKKWAQTPKLLYPVFIALIVFISIWTKLTYGWMIPGIIVLQALLLFEERDHLKKMDTEYLLNQVYLSVIICTVCTATLLFSTEVNNPTQMPLLDQLFTQSGKSYSFVSMVNDVQTLPALHILFNPLETANRIYEIRPAGALAYFYSFLVYGSLPFILFALWCGKRISSVALLRSSVGYGIFLMTFFFIAKNREVWTMHHTVLALPFFVFAIAALFAGIKWNQRLRLATSCVATLFIALNLYFFLVMISQPVLSEADPSRHTINQILADKRLAQRYLYISIDRGMYFLQAMYGHPDQRNIFREPLKYQWQVDEIKTALYADNRKALFIYDTKVQLTDLDYVREHFDVVRCRAIPENAVWQVLLEADEEGNTCL
ncbi:MAG: hypothetical protein O2904_03060 [bacterium]|nr:hypothetical protein [bacterium]